MFKNNPYVDKSYAAHVAEFASSVLSIKDGNLVPHEFENSAYKTQHSADSVDGEELEDPKYTLTQPEKAEKKAQAAQNLRIADRQVYRTYFSAIGWTHGKLVVFKTFCFLREPVQTDVNLPCEQFIDIEKPQWLYSSLWA